ncbi:MAG: hypothetical protein GY757_49360 [bacterium]|nr:hypothetical protein [bacterium]
MSSKEEYQLKFPEITTIPEEQLEPPSSIPMQKYVQEAEDLFRRCQRDQAELIANGLVWDETVMDIPVRAGTLREAESLWCGDRNTRADMAKQWALEAPVAYELRDELLKAFRFAFRDDDDLLKKVSEIAKGNSHSDMLQDLNNLSILGLKHPAPLAAINFDVTQLDLAAQKADDLSVLLANTSSEREESRETKKVRDQAFTHLKEIVDEVYSFGKYVFRSNEKRRNGYRSKYLYLQWLKRSSEPESEPEPEPGLEPREEPLAEMSPVVDL